MIIVTGAAGFIGSCLIGYLNTLGHTDIVAVDKFESEVKYKNLDNKKIKERVDRDDFFNWMDLNYKNIRFIYHLGARTDTTEFDKALLYELNTLYTQNVWNKCIQYHLPLVYASSAATYGLGELGYEDSEKIIPDLAPLNPYGESKNDFDKWAIDQQSKPPLWVGLKFFNVYGPNEYHKGRMASVVFHAFNQIQSTGKMKLFRSHREDFKDGEQMRDFIYVRDVVNVCTFFVDKTDVSGIYNLGSGRARTFLDLVRAVFKAVNKDENIEFIDTPADIRDKYQYFTEATMDKLKHAGYSKDFYSLEQGVEEYVKTYLISKSYM